MNDLPAPVIVEHDGILVVRDDLILGGTKARVLPLLLQQPGEYVYAGPCEGYAQVALAYCCQRLGRQATLFCAARRVRHPRTAEAAAAGAQIIEVGPAGYLSVVRARAAAYCRERGATLLPFGLDVPELRDALAVVALGLGVTPSEVWTVAGSGMLSRALQQAWPAAQFYAVRIGAEPDAGGAEVLVAPERFGAEARMPPPFPACGNYDAKAWRFIRARASRGALFWNVAR